MKELILAVALGYLLGRTVTAFLAIALGALVKVVVKRSPQIQRFLRKHSDEDQVLRQRVDPWRSKR